MPADGNRILNLAESISDGAPVDWAREEESSAQDRDRALVRSLKVVAMVSRLQRDPAPDEKTLIEKTSREDGSPGGALLPIGRYGTLEVRERIGRGSYGEVYRAWDARLEREVALKILAPRGDDEIALLLAEGRRLASVKHPNVVTVYSADRIEGRPAIWMEMIEGRTLAEIVREHGPLGADEIAAVAGPLCRALAAVHGAGLVHQDVKAQNVMRAQGGRIVLMDFGPGGTTPLYAAPEVLEGRPASPRSDIYSAGVLLFHLATGTYPVLAKSIDDLRAAHAGGRAVHVSDHRADLPPALGRVIERALATDAAARFATAGEMEAAIAVAMAGPAAIAGPAAMRAPRSAPARSARRWRSAAAAALLAAIAAAAVAVGVWALRDRTITTPRDVAARLGGAAAAGGADAAGPFRVEAAFFRGGRQRERLTNGARVAVGDSVSLRIQSSESLFVYVINEDDRGEAFVLFPAAGFEPANPLSPSAAHALPGTRAGVPFYWQVTSAGGREHLVVIGSRARLVGLEAEMLAVARPEEGRAPDYPRLSGAARDQLRGMGGFVADAPEGAVSSPGGRLSDLAKPLADGPEDASGVWIRRIDLENPGR
jgi:serine/threonine-protein kinase